MVTELFRRPPESEPQNRVSLYDFLEPIVGAANLPASSDTSGDNFFARLFEVLVSFCLVFRLVLMGFIIDIYYLLNKGGCKGKSFFWVSTQIWEFYSAFIVEALP